MHHPRIHHLFLAGALVMLAAGVPLVAQELTVRYQRAEQFLPANVHRQVFNLEIRPHWIDGSSRFWYLSGSPKGKTFMYVDPATASRTPAFDHARLARSLSTALKQPLDPAELPFDTIEFTDKGTAVEFTVNGDRWRCRLSDYTCTRKTEPAPPPGLSPDGQWAAFVRDHNLWVTHRPTGQTIQLTFDGVKDDDYATPLPDPAEMVRQGTMVLHPDADVIWSPDSRYILTYRIDQRQAGHMYLVQSSPPDGGRPRLFSYTYPLPGERTLPLARIIICDVAQRKIRMVDAPPIPLCYYGNPWWGRWMEPDGTFRYLDRSRGYDTVTLREITLASGTVRTVFTEHADTYVDPNFWDLYFFHDSPEFLWTSERDGWNHLYLFDARDGRLKHRVTRGEWVFRDLVHVDEKARQVYFLAGGREPGLDPYLRILYRVDLDGGHLVRLTPENMDHSVRFSPDGTWFLDTFSSVDTPPVTLLRRSADGATVMQVERADVSGLLAQGYRAPEAFRAKARDGKTDIYGVIYRPFDFDPARTYSVVDKIYTGPHNFFAPKTYWACASDANSIAQLGCIVI